MAGDYIQHDLTAHSDPKIARLILRHGTSGYGAYWLTIEMLSQCGGNAPAMRDFDMVETLVAMGRMTPENATKIITEMVSLDLLQKTDKGLCSESLNRRLCVMSERKDAARKASAMRWHSDTHSDGKAKRNPLKVIKDIYKEIDKEKAPIFRDMAVVRLSEDAFVALQEKHPDALDWLEKIDAYCQSTGKTYKDYAAAVRSWKLKETGKAELSEPEIDYPDVEQARAMRVARQTKDLAGKNSLLKETAKVQ